MPRDPLWWKEMAGDFVVYPPTEKEVEEEDRQRRERIAEFERELYGQDVSGLGSTNEEEHPIEILEKKIWEIITDGIRERPISLDGETWEVIE